jgi:hypothetical protein
LRPILFVGACVACLVPAWGRATLAQSPAPDRLPEGEGRVTVESLCASRCHTASTILRARRTPLAWEVVLDQMIERGAELSDSEYDTILGYLSERLLATVNVNTATVEGIVAVLEIDPKEAQAIVEARKASALTSWQDVANVPGVDAKVIEARKARLVFM